MKEDPGITHNSNGSMAHVIDTCHVTTFNTKANYSRNICHANVPLLLAVSSHHNNALWELSLTSPLEIVLL